MRTSNVCAYVHRVSLCVYLHEASARTKTHELPQIHTHGARAHTPAHQGRQARRSKSMPVKKAKSRPVDKWRHCRNKIHSKTKLILSPFLIYGSPCSRRPRRCSGCSLLRPICFSFPKTRSRSPRRTNLPPRPTCMQHPNFQQPSRSRHMMRLYHLRTSAQGCTMSRRTGTNVHINNELKIENCVWEGRVC